MKRERDDDTPAWKPAPLPATTDPQATMRRAHDDELSPFQAEARRDLFDTYRRHCE